jgi:hypothetical protein
LFSPEIIGEGGYPNIRAWSCGRKLADVALLNSSVDSKDFDIDDNVGNADNY